MVTEERLEPLLRRVEDTLGPATRELELFELWALGCVRGLEEAARCSREELAQEVQAVRSELLELQATIRQGVGSTARAELLQLCRREWLMAVLDLIEQLFEAVGADELLVA